jgi:hypothetical protein
MSERKFELDRDGLGLLLFALGLFPSVLIVKAMQSSTPLDHVTGDGPIASTWIGALGTLPSLAFTVAVAFLGGRLFLAGKRDGIARNALGMALTSLGFAAFLGAFSPTAGGRVGEATGGLVSSKSHVVVGALFGLVALALPIWFMWFRKEREPRIATDPDSEGGRTRVDEPDDGVSAEEAAALVPDDFDRAIDAGRTQLATRPTRSASPTSPYPEDVRLKGEIPAGARPLERAHDAEEEPQSADQPSSVYRWTAARAGELTLGAGEDLAVEREAEHVFEAQPIGEREEVALEPDATRTEAIAPAFELNDDAVDAVDEVEATTSAAPPEPIAHLPRPSWEQPSMFEEGEEPVDAYGTPRVLIDALRRDDGVEGAAPAEGSGSALQRDDGLEDELEFEAVATRDDDAAEVADELDDDAETGEALDADAEISDERDEDAGDELDDETDEDDDVDEEDSLEDAAADEELDEPLPSADVELERVERDVESAPAHDAGIAVPGDELAEEHEPISPVESAPREAKSKSAPAKSGSRSRAREPQADLEGPLVELMDKREDGESAEPAALPIASEPPASTRPMTARSGESVTGEREIVLQPRAVSREKAIKSQPVLGERTQLLRDAGCLFVDRGRVAVSMLQRQYGMDFDEACKVLDELQDLGLIGPYLGGQHRDILLTRDQWLEKVGGV